MAVNGLVFNGRSAWALAQALGPKLGVRPRRCVKWIPDAQAGEGGRDAQAGEDGRGGPISAELAKINRLRGRCGVDFSSRIPTLAT